MWRTLVFLSLMVLPLKKIYSQDTQESRLLNKAYELWSRGENDSALFTLDKLSLSAKDKRDSSLTANIAYTRGIIYVYSGASDSALFHLEKSRRIAKNTSAFQLLGMSLELEGQLRKSQGLLVRALELYDSARSVYQRHNLDNFMGTVLTEIGNLEISLENYEAGKKNHANALQFYQKTKDTANLGLGKSNLAYAYSKLQEFDEAVLTFRDAIALKRKYSTERSLSFTYQYLGEAFLEMNESDSASKYLDLSYTIKKEVGDQKGMAETANLLARLSIGENAMTRARLLLDSAYHWAVSINSLSLIIENLEIQKDWYMRTGRFQEALEADYRYDVLRDSLFKDEKLKVERLQAEYSLNEKEQERQLEESRADLAEASNRQQSTLLYLSILVLLALAVLIYFIWRARQLTIEKNALLESRTVLIEQQKNDIRHRTKNHMGMVNYMLTLLKKETTNDALIKHIQSTQHLLFTFSSLETHLYDLKDEQSIDIAIYLQEWKDKFLGNLPQLQSDFDIELEAEHVKVSHQHLLSIALIITELATNAVKYIGMQGTATVLKVSFKSQKDEMILTIADNGPGIEDDSQQGMGWKIIHTLIKSMKARSNAQNDEGFHFEVVIPTKKAPRV